MGEDTTEYRLLTKDYVKVVECDGRKILKVDPKGLEELSKAAYSDVSFYLRASHLQKLRNILQACFTCRCSSRTAAFRCGEKDLLG